MASLIPFELNLRDTIDQTHTIHFEARSGGENFITSTDSLKVEAAQSVAVKGYDVNMLCNGGNFGIRNGDYTVSYFLPKPVALPLQDQVIQFNSDGTSQFATVGGGGGNFSTPSNQALDMNTHAISGVADLSLVSPTDPARTASLVIRDNNTTTLSTNQALSLNCAGQDMETVSNGFRMRMANGGTLAIFNDSGYFVFPSDAPTVNDSYINFGANGFSTWQVMPPNLSSQVATLEQKVADLSTVIYNLTGITIP
jgi:hypothetical protein